MHTQYCARASPRRWHQVLATLLAILCCFGGFLANAVFVDDLYLFGATTEDKRIQGVDDEVSPTPEITLPIPFVLYDRAFRNAFINNNGAVTFESNTDSSFTYIILPGASIPIIAPYWADVDTTNNGTLWYRLSNETSLLERFAGDVSSSFLGKRNFYPLYLIISTWEKVGYHDASKDKTNTFQCVLGSDGVSSFSLFLYENNGIHWTTGDAEGGILGLGGSPAKAGFDSSDGVHYFELPMSGKSEILNISQTSNIDRPGAWMFQIDREVIVSGGCAIEANGTILSINPTSFNSRGGTLLEVQVVCGLQATDAVWCSFEEADAVGVYISELRGVVCVAPALQTAGWKELHLLVTNEAGVNESVGTATFYAIPYLEGYEVFATSESNNLLLVPNSKVQLHWLPSAVVSPLAVDGGIETLTVDIKMARLDFSTNQWINSATLEANISNTGNVTIIVPDIILGNNEIGVNPVAFDISPSENHVEVAGLSGIAKMLKISSSVFYLQVTDFKQERCQSWLQKEKVYPDCNAEHSSCPVTSEKAQLPNSGYVLMSFASTQASLKAIQEKINMSVDATLLYLSSFNTGSDLCYQQRRLCAMDTFIHQCCYRDGKLIVGSPGGGKIFYVPPEQDILQHFMLDLVPYLWCCQAGQQSDCSSYYQLRSSDNGMNSTLTLPAMIFGDPHFISLDGNTYTFNGKGEFDLVVTEDNTFRMQGRMIEAPSDGLARATVLSAIVANLTNSETVQLEVARDELRIYVGSRRVFFDNLNNVQLRDSTIYKLDNEGDKFGVSFSNGAYIEVTKENGFFSTTIVSLPEEFIGKTLGLLGLYNQDESDDFTSRPPTSVETATNPSLEDIHNQFGLSWMILSDESLFHYRPKESNEYYNCPEFMPVYTITDSVDDTVCMNDTFCLFDVAVTGNPSIGKATLAARTLFADIKQLSKPVTCNPSCVNGACVSTNVCFCGDGYYGQDCSFSEITTVTTSNTSTASEGTTSESTTSDSKNRTAKTALVVSIVLGTAVLMAVIVLVMLVFVMQCAWKKKKSQFPKHNIRDEDIMDSKETIF